MHFLAPPHVTSAELVPGTRCSRRDQRRSSARFTERTRACALVLARAHSVRVLTLVRKPHWAAVGCGTPQRRDGRRARGRGARGGGAVGGGECYTARSARGGGWRAGGGAGAAGFNGRGAGGASAAARVGERRWRRLMHVCAQDARAEIARLTALARRGDGVDPSVPDDIVGVCPARVRTRARVECARTPQCASHASRSRSRRRRPRRWRWCPATACSRKRRSATAGAPAVARRRRRARVGGRAVPARRRERAVGGPARRGWCVLAGADARKRLMRRGAARRGARRQGTRRCSCRAARTSASCSLTGAGVRSSRA